jgi:glycosyltransferase involved in cell wall biosynthesis
MKVLVVSNLYPPVVFGGYEILCRQVTEKLVSRGNAVEVLTSSFEDGPVLPVEGVKRSLEMTTRFPLTGENVGFVDFRLPTMQRVAHRNFEITFEAIRAAQPDVVFCWCLNRVSVGPIFAAQAAGVPVCYTINDEHPRQFKPVSGAHPKALARYAMEKWHWNMATFRNLKPFPMTTISQALKDSLLEQGTPVERAEVIYQGIPLEDFPYRPCRKKIDEPWKILYVGQLSENKGVHTLLEAAAQLDQTGVKQFQISLVGRGVPEYQEKLQAFVREEHLEDRVSFLGQRPHSEISDFYRNHHLFIFPSLWKEPFGLTHLEAMASGCAVISTTRGGCAELIRHGENALAFEARNSNELASRMGDLMGDEVLRRRLIVRAREWIESHHSLDGYVNRIESFLRKTIAGQSCLS